MFADLLADVEEEECDLHDEPAPAPADAAVPAVVAGRRGGHRPAGGRRGRSRGFAHSPATRARISSGRLKTSVATLKRTIEATIPVGAVEVVQRAFSPVCHKAARFSLSDFVDDSGCVMNLVTDVSKDVDKTEDRALVSHVAAQALHIAFLTDRAANHGFLLFANVYDDASMWIRRPPGDVGPSPEEEIARCITDTALQKELRKRKKHGRQMHCPVLNMVESIFVLSGCGGAAEQIHIEAVCPHSPCQVLPEANYSTVLDRWRRWTVGSGSPSAGSKVDPHRVIALDVAGSWSSIVMVKDGLMLNNNMVRKVEDALRDRRLAAGLRSAEAAESVPSLLHYNCIAHNTVLCMKPLVRLVHTGLSSFVVRLGHLCESSRQFGRVLGALDQLLSDDRCFKFRRVLRMPAGFEQWQRHSSEVMRLAECALDLTPAQTVEILYFDNGDWNSPEVTHWCVSGCRCGGRKETARRLTKAAIMMSLSSGCPVALEYRWKHMERAMGWAYRGRAQHDLLQRALQASFLQKDIEKAVANVQAAGEDGAEISAKQTVRTGKIIEFTAGDKNGMLLKKGLLYVRPLQHCLNLIFKSEEATMKYTAAAALPGLDTDLRRRRELAELQRISAKYASFLHQRRGRVESHRSLCTHHRQLRR